MKKFPKLQTLFLVLLTLLRPLTADETTTQLVPSAEMHTETLYMMRCLSGIHYDRKPVSSFSMAEILATYFKDLDPLHLFFLQSDITEIQTRYNLTLDIFLNSGSIKPAFVIYNLFQQRVQERLEEIHQLLQEPFPFSTEDCYNPDRKDAPWPLDKSEMGKAWRDRLTYELINEILAMDGHETSDDETIEDSALELVEAPKTEKNLTSDAERIALAKENLKKRYDRMKTSISDIEPYFIEELFLNSVTKMYDPHSSFLSADSLEDFQVALTNSLVGIGAILADDNGYCKILEIYPGSPAEASQQLHPGDRILAVAQENQEPVEIIGMRLNRAVKLIRGKKGTRVTLYVQPADSDPSQRKAVPIIRDEIQLTAQRARAKLFTLHDDHSQADLPFGYIKLPAFYGASENDSNSDSFHDVKELIEKLSHYKIHGLVLDLRGNSGGLLDEAISLAGLFLPPCPVVQVRDGNGHVQVFSDTNGNMQFAGPLVVLASKQSVSASEILAGALQCHHRAVVVGDKSTHGKGSVQAILPINQSFLYLKNGPKLGAARITIQKWYLPNGDSIQQKGVEADIRLPSFNDFLPIGESDYEHSLKWDKISSAMDKTKSPLSAPENFASQQLVALLRETNQDRLNGDELRLLQERVRLFGEKMKTKTFSLQLEERRQQVAQDREIQKSLDQKLDLLAKDASYSSIDIYIDAAEEQRVSDREKKRSHSRWTDFDIPLRESLHVLRDWDRAASGKYNGNDLATTR